MHEFPVPHEEEQNGEWVETSSNLAFVRYSLHVWFSVGSSLRKIFWEFPDIIQNEILPK